MTPPSIQVETALPQRDGNLLSKQAVGEVERLAAAHLIGVRLDASAQPLSNVHRVHVLLEDVHVLGVAQRERDERRKERHFAVLVDEEEEGEPAQLAQQRRDALRVGARDEAEHGLQTRALFSKSVR